MGKLVSIAMTTYNGEKYIFKQLVSIINQTMLPHQVVICDDGSSDKTIEIVHDFIEKHNLENWSIIRNHQNVGFVKNFIQALKLTTGDIIFFADQDDLWLPDKIEKMVLSMVANPKIKSLCGDYFLIDSNDEPILNKTIHRQKSKFSGECKKISLNSIMGISLYRGCTMCISKEIIPYLDIIDPQKHGHDWLVNVIAAIEEGAYTLDYPVIQYRVYDSNTSGVGSTQFLGWSLEERRECFRLSPPEDLTPLFPIVEILSSDSQKSRNLKCIRNAMVYRNRRVKFLYTGNLLAGLSLVKYLRWYHGAREYIGDFFYVLHWDGAIRRLVGLFKNKKCED